MESVFWRMRVSFVNSTLKLLVNTSSNSNSESDSESESGFEFDADITTRLLDFVVRFIDTGDWSVVSHGFSIFKTILIGYRSFATTISTSGIVDATIVSLDNCFVFTWMKVVKVVALVIIDNEIGSTFCAAGLIGRLASLVASDLEGLDREVLVCIRKTSDISIRVLRDVVSSGILTQINVSGLQFRTKIEFGECLATVMSLSAQRLDAEHNDTVSNLSEILEMLWVMFVTGRMMT
jgi:hypothetical protein